MREPIGESQEPKIGESEMQDDLSEVLAEEIENEAEQGLNELEKENTDKKSKWKTVKGEVEVEGKKLEITYREKVIELPKYRQEQTGITRIRRRELLPPLPEGLFLPKDDKKKIIEGKEVEMLSHYSSDKKFDNVYNLLSDGGHPCHGTLVHIMNFMEWRHRDKIEKFKKEGLYFQKIHCQSEEGFSFCADEMYEDKFATPVFVFGNRNSKFLEYLNFVENSPEEEWGIDEISPEIKGDFRRVRNRIKFGPQEIRWPHFGRFKNSKEHQLRWCHAECALVPTKRGLNVLFFETGDEEKDDEKDDEK